MGNSIFAVGLLLKANSDLIRARAEPFLHLATEVKSFVISNEVRNLDFGCLNER